ncbi:hypothetical protein H8356DRAFT_1719859, partial [Neocallimastix lanati (nom. inval.)]
MKMNHHLFVVLLVLNLRPHYLLIKLINLQNLLLKLQMIKIIVFPPPLRKIILKLRMMNHRPIRKSIRRIVLLFI